MADANLPIEGNNFEDAASILLPPNSEDLSDTADAESSTGQLEYTEMSECSQEPTLVLPPTPRQVPKRKRSSDVMLAVTSSLQRLVHALESSKDTSGSHELLQAVLEIDGLDEAKQMYAFEYLNADPIKARAFMTYNVRMRKVFLFRQFSWWK